MIVALHGFTGAPASWDAVRARSEGRWSCPRVLGHGAEAEGVESFDDEVDRLAMTMPDGATLVGYSLGARLALGIAVRQPARVGRLVLIGGHPGLEDGAEAATRRADDEARARALETEGLEPFVNRWEALPLFGTQRRLPEAVQAAHRARRLSHDPHQLARSLRVLGLGGMPSRWLDLSALPMPVDLLVGGEDPKFRALAERFVAVRPGTTLRVVPGAGHDLTLEAPGAVASALAPSSPSRVPCPR